MSAQERWLKPWLSYKARSRMAFVCKRWCEALGIEARYNSPQWQTVACIARNLDSLGIGKPLIVPLGRQAQPWDDFFPLDFKAKKAFLEYLEQKGIVKINKGFTSKTSTVEIIEAGLWSNLKSEIISPELIPWDSRIGKSFIKKAENGIVEIKLDLQRTDELGQINRDMQSLIKSLEFNPDEFDYAALKALKVRNYEKYLTVIDNFLFFLSSSSPSSSSPCASLAISWHTVETSESINEAVESGLTAFFHTANGGIKLAQAAVGLHQIQIMRKRPDASKHLRWQNQGGRLYSEILGISGIFRRGLRVNALRYVELDLKSSHIFFAYALAGLKMPLDYALSQAPCVPRKAVKLGLLIALNASDRASAQSALPSELCDAGLPSLSSLGLTPTQIYDFILNEYAPIKDFLFKDFGVQFMGYEGQLCLDCVQWGLNRQEIIIPIHDGFLCPERITDELKQFIQDNLKSKFNQTPTVERK